MQPSLLLIEHDKLLQALFKTKLSKDFAVFSVEGAQAAMDILDDEHVFIEVIVMDVQMDRNNGIELLHEIRSYDDWLDVPIILLSSTPPSRLPLDRLKKYGVERVLYKAQTSPTELLTATKRVVREYAE